MLQVSSKLPCRGVPVPPVLHAVVLGTEGGEVIGGIGASLVHGDFVMKMGPVPVGASGAVGSGLGALALVAMHDFVNFGSGSVLAPRSWHAVRPFALNCP